MSLAEQLAVAAVCILAAAVLFVFGAGALAWLADRAGQWAREQARAYRDRYERPAPQLGDDVIAMIRRAREEDEAEAQADFEREAADMIERYGRG